MSPTKGTDEMTTIHDLTDRELEGEIAHARNRRDAFSAGREPADVLANLRTLLAEQERRRHARRVERAAAMSRVGYADPAMCQWFAACGNLATTTRPHPVLGDVPICERCDAKVDAIGGQR